MNEWCIGDRCSAVLLLLPCSLLQFYLPVFRVYYRARWTSYSCPYRSLWDCSQEVLIGLSCYLFTLISCCSAKWWHGHYCPPMHHVSVPRTPAKVIKQASSIVSANVLNSLPGMPTIPLLAELFRISPFFPPFCVEFVKFRFSIPFIWAIKTWYFHTQIFKKKFYHPMPSVKLKLHHNKNRTRPQWGSLQCSRTPSSWISIYRPFGPLLSALRASVVSDSSFWFSNVGMSALLKNVCKPSSCRVATTNWKHIALGNMWLEPFPPQHSTSESDCHYGTIQVWQSYRWHSSECLTCCVYMLCIQVWQSYRWHSSECLTCCVYMLCI